MGFFGKELSLYLMNYGIKKKRNCIKQFLLREKGKNLENFMKHFYDSEGPLRNNSFSPQRCRLLKLTTHLELIWRNFVQMINLSTK
jgi:hypothetical protein